MKRKLLRVLAGAIALTGIGSTLFTSTAYAAGVKLLGENGLCLTVSDAVIGAVPVQTDCTQAHNIVWDTGHANIYIEGHPGFCIASGDPNAFLFIDACSNGRSVLKADATNAGFFRFRFVNVGTYAHANGNGQPITMITNPGNSLAVYWLPDTIG